jgi:hypothetical protein
VQRALLCCARARLDETARRELNALLREGIDLAALTAEARRHGLVPVVCRHLEEAGLNPHDVPDLAPLHAGALKDGAWSLAMAAELGAVLEALSSAGVTALAIKGPATAALGYEDLGLRTFSDLDLLIRPADLEQAWAVLETRGYSPTLTLPRAWRARLRRRTYELTFQHSDGRRVVDLHWSLLRPGYSFTPGFDGVFARTTVVAIGPRSVPTLAAEPTLLFLLLHGAKHDWERLGWLCDVGELLRRHPDLDWQAVIEWSAPVGRRRLIDVGLAMAHAMVDAPVPRQVLERGRSDSRVADIAGTLARRLLAPPAPPRRWFPETLLRVQYLRSMARGRDRLRFLHEILLRPTPLEWQTVPLPPSLAQLHYVVRPVRLLLKHAARTVGRTRTTEGLRDAGGEPRSNR